MSRSIPSGQVMSTRQRWVWLSHERRQDFAQCCGHLISLGCGQILRHDREALLTQLREDSVCQPVPVRRMRARESHVLRSNISLPINA